MSCTEGEFGKMEGKLLGVLRWGNDFIDGDWKDRDY